MLFLTSELANKAEITIFSARDTTRAWLPAMYNTWLPSGLQNRVHFVSFRLIFLSALRNVGYQRRCYWSDESQQLYPLMASFKVRNCSRKGKNIFFLLTSLNTVQEYGRRIQTTWSSRWFGRRKTYLERWETWPCSWVFSKKKEIFSNGCQKIFSVPRVGFVFKFRRSQTQSFKPGAANSGSNLVVLTLTSCKDQGLSCLLPSDEKAVFYSPRTDPDPEKISNLEIIPKSTTKWFPLFFFSTPKWSPRNKGMVIKHGLWIAQ